MDVRPFWRARGAALALLVVVAIAGPESRSAAHNRETKVTWTTDIEAILERRCVGCHATSGFAPMSLATYQDARTWAPSIRREVLERRMPPWPAAPGFGAFLNDRSLTPIEIELLTAWTDGNTPLGPPVDPPQSEDARHKSPMQPDLIVAERSARAVTALTSRIELPTGLTSDRWITGWEFRPGNRTIVEQAVLTILPSTILGAWTPPDAPIVYPSGVAQRLPAGSRLALDLRYRKAATPQVDQSGVALYFGARPKGALQHRSLACGANPIDREIEALAVAPRASAAGESLEVLARRPDGSVEALAVVPKFEPAYPITYRFRSGVRLGRGATIEVRSSSPQCGSGLEFVSR
jgi:hypothetical protein